MTPYAATSPWLLPACRLAPWLLVILRCVRRVERRGSVQASELSYADKYSHRLLYMRTGTGVTRAVQGALSTAELSRRWSREAGAHDAGGLLVCSGDPGGVVAEG